MKMNSSNIMQYESPIKNPELLSRLTDSANKLKSIEEKQQKMLQQQYDSQTEELKKNYQQFEHIQTQRMTNEKRVLDINQSIQDLINSVIKDKTLSEKSKMLLQQNQKLMTRFIQLLHLNKSSELLNTDQIIKLKETRRTLKQQCIDAENFIRNNYSLEKEETKTKIQNLQRNSSSLAQEIRRNKNEIQSVIESQKTLKESSAFQNYISLINEIEISIQEKEREIKLLTESIQQKKARLSKLNSFTELIENEIRKNQEELQLFQV